MDITLEEIERAAHDKSPLLAELVCSLASEVEPAPKTRSQGLSWYTLNNLHKQRSFVKLDREQKRQRRLADWRAIEADDAELPDRYKLYRVLMSLWSDDSTYSRQQLIRIIERVPLRHGPWRAVKRIFKEAEARSDFEIYGALAARFDTEHARAMAHISPTSPEQTSPPGALQLLLSRAKRAPRDVDPATLRYLAARAWRTLRTLAVRLPSAYPDAACAVLRCYPPKAPLLRSWIANHIFFHEDKAYGRSTFRRAHYRGDTLLLQHRAFGELWQHTPRPLFSLLEAAKNDTVRAFAADSLKAHFRTQLRESEPDWVVRLVGAGSRSVDAFVIWLLDNVPRFEASNFRALGLHEAALALLLSEDTSAAAWAAGYARTYARDIPLREGPAGSSVRGQISLLSLLGSPHTPVRDLARDLLQALDPRQDVGLAAWGELLGTPHGHSLAEVSLREHFSAEELTLDWFRQRLLSDNYGVVQFARSLLAKIHPEETIPTSFWAELLDNPSATQLGSAALDALQERAKRGVLLDDLDPDILKRALLNPRSRSRVMAWVREGRLQASTLGADLLRALAETSTWDSDPWILALLRSELSWVEGLAFDDALSAWALDRLRDARTFSGAVLGFDWLCGLVQGSVARYQRFATEILTRDFRPSDFADFARGPSAPARGDRGGAAIAGAERLWELATEPGPADAPLRRFALHYLRLHHPDVHLAEREEPLPEEAALPEGFRTFARARALCADERMPLRDLGLLWLKWDLAHMSPPMSDLVELCELPYPEVRAFVTLALTAEEALVHERYRVDPDSLTVEGVYRFCRSLDRGCRALGMLLVSRYPRLAVPEELFSLAESPDRTVRAFAVRALWRMYRDSGTTTSLSAPHSEQPTDPTASRGPRRPRWPASASRLRDFLRRSLFELPAARGKSRSEQERIAPGVQPSAKSKAALIEIMRDLAAEDIAFGEMITPILEEFLGSDSRTESMAALVALTRIRAAGGGR